MSDNGIIGSCLFILLFLACLSYCYPVFCFYDPESGVWMDGTYDLITRVHVLTLLEYLAPGRMDAQDAGRPEVGEQRRFYAVDFSRSGSSYSTDATCRAVGDHCYIFVEDSQWIRGAVTNTDVVKLKRAFDTATPGDPGSGIYVLETTNLGPPPDDIDLDPKIYILILDIPDNYNTLGTFIAGYFEPLNQKRGVFRDPRTGAKLYSNEVEMVYIDSNPLDASSIMACEILAHEFQHLIHWRHDPDEEIWVNEGCSDYASLFLCGYGTEHSWHIDAFENNPQVSLTYWPAGAGSPLANYGAAFLWIVYLHEHYGGTSTISSLIAEPDNGIVGINNVLAARGFSQNFDAVFSDWKVANFLDDTSFDSGRYGYKSLNLSVRPTSRHFSLPASNASQYVDSWAANYIEIAGGSGGMDLQVDFNSRNPAYDFDVRAVSMKSGAPIAVSSMRFDGLGNGHISVPEFGYAVDTVVLIPNWKSGRSISGESIAYSYAARLGKEISLDVAVLPNAVHERYVDFVVRFNQSLGVGIPKITITRPGKIVVREQDMVRMSVGNQENDIYVFQLYAPCDWDGSEIQWSISYLGRSMDAGNLGNILR